jgi:fibronectin type 3 domain-containing protein
MMTVAGRTRRLFFTGVTAAALTVGSLAGMATSAQAATADKPARTWGTNGRVNIILPVGDRIFIGGEFTAVVDTNGDSHPASNLAVFSASTGAFDLSYQGSANGLVNALVAANGRLYIGGQFSKADGVSRTRLAALDLATGVLDGSWTPAVDQPVDAIAAGAGAVFVAGAFLNVTDGTGTHARGYIAKLDSATGALDAGWAPVPNDRTRALALSPDGSQIYFAGDFKKVNNNGQVRIIAEVSTSDPAVLAPFRATATNNTNFAQVFDIAVDSTAVYSAVGGSGGACTAMNLTTGDRIWSKHANGNLQSVRVLNGQVYCGGHFGGSTSFDGLPRQKIAIVNEAAPYATTSFAPNVDSPLGTWSVGVDGGHLYLGGDFATVAGIIAPHFAEFIDTTLQTAPLAPAASATSGDSVVHLSWSPPSTDGGQAIKSYNIYRRLTPGGVYGKKLATVKAVTTYDDTTVTNGTTYGYVVTAVNALGESAQSAEVAGAPLTSTQTPPSAPQSFLASSGAGSVALSWSAPASNGNSPVTGYVLYRGTASGAETQLAALPASALSYSDTSITAGTTYFYVVTATNAIGEGSAAPEVSATPTAGVPGPLTVSATADPGVVHLSWSHAAFDGGSPVTKYAVIRDGVRLVTLSGVDTLTYDDTAVASGETHAYQVRAVNVVGSGPNSAKTTITVP